MYNSLTGDIIPTVSKSLSESLSDTVTTVPAGELVEKIFAVSKLIRQASRDLPIPPHHLRGLRIIATEPIRPARLAERLHITPRAVTDVVDALVAADFITVGDDPTDRRAKVLTITSGGEEVVHTAQRVREEKAQALFSQLSPQQQRDLNFLLAQILDH